MLTRHFSFESLGIGYKPSIQPHKISSQFIVEPHHHTVPVADLDLELKGGEGVVVLSWLASWLFFLLLLYFFFTLRGGGGPFPWVYH